MQCILLQINNFIKRKKNRRFSKKNSLFKLHFKSFNSKLLLTILLLYYIRILYQKLSFRLFTLDVFTGSINLYRNFQCYQPTRKYKRNPAYIIIMLLFVFERQWYPPQRGGMQVYGFKCVCLLRENIFGHRPTAAK